MKVDFFILKAFCRQRIVKGEVCRSRLNEMTGKERSCKEACCPIGQLKKEKIK